MTPRITSLACPLERPYSLRTVKGDGKGRGMIDTLTHLDRLEAESIHIMREVMADAAKPVMLYSVGKDSAVMLHLARKAFRSEEHTSELQSLMRISYAVFCLK